MDNDNVIPFGSIRGDKPDDDKIPENDYYLLNSDGDDFFATGFAIFTPHHIAIMRDVEGKGPIPVLVMPLNTLRVCELVDPTEDDDQQDLL